MKKTLLSLAAVCCAFAMNAQEITVEKPFQLMKGVEDSAFFPVLSQDGSKMLFTSGDYTGLKVYSFEDGTVQKISDAHFAGYEAKFAEDGNVYYTIRNKTVGAKNNVVYSCDLETMKSQQKFSNKIIKNVRRSEAMSQNLSVYTDLSEVVVCKNGKEYRYSPVESQAGYMWSSLSPDKTKILFFAAGKGIVVMDLNGNVLNMLGNYEAPVWFGNDYIVAQNATDDGHNFLSSQIMLLKADGSLKKELTKPLSMSMFPAASSAKAGKVAYNTIDGRMFIMNVTIK